MNEISFELRFLEETNYKRETNQRFMKRIGAFLAQGDLPSQQNRVFPPFFGIFFN